MTPLPKTFLLAAALAWSGIAAAVVSIRNEPAPVMAKAAEFDARWDDATELKKQDRLPLLTREADWRPAQEPEPIPKYPEPDVVPPVKMPAVVAIPNEDDDRPVSRRTHRTRDVCEKHGKRKVAIRGRSWKCR